MISLTPLGDTFFNVRYTGEDYGNNKSKDKVMPAQIPELAKQNFPLCMKSMQEVIVIIDSVDLVKLGLDFFLTWST